MGRAEVGRWREAGLGLAIAADGLRVRENPVGTQLPAACAERHIELDGGFCQGLVSPRLERRRDAEAWWRRLEQFLLCQSAAADTGVWPLGHGLDHGDAGEHHRRALRLAEKLGVQEAYLDAYLDAPSWFTSTGLNLLGDRRRGAAAAARLRPPRVRGRRARLALLEIVILERARRKHLAAFWKDLQASNRRCCGAMRDCRLDRSVDQIQSGLAA